MNNHQFYFVRKISFLCSRNQFFLLSFLFCAIAVLIFTNSVSAQLMNWQYVAALGRNTSKIYLNDEVKVLANKNVTAWQKLRDKRRDLSILQKRIGFL